MRQVAFLIPLLAVGLGAQQPPTPPASVAPKMDRSAKPGVGDLLISPQRLFFEGPTRTQELTLINVGPRTATYRIFFTQMDMAEDGNLNETKEKTKDGKYAEDVLRYSPRQVTLEPGIAQTVRLSLRKPEGISVGEYRSHLVFRYVPEPEPTKVVDPKEPEPTGLSISFIALPGIAAPIVVRHGATTATATWESASLTPGTPPTLEASLARNGNQSIYGDLRVTFTPAGSSEKVIVYSMNWAAVYDPLPRRRFKLPLNLPGGPTAKGSLRLQFLAPETDKPLAETKLDIN